MSAIDQIQEHFGSLSEAFEASKNLKDFAEIVKILVNDSIEEHNEGAADPDLWEKVSTVWVGRHITIRNLAEVNRAVLEVFGISLPNAEDTAPKAEAGQ